MSDSSRYRIPSEDQVHAALARLTKLPLRRAFYSKLENPHWVAALAGQGAFRNPPETEVMPDGLVRSDPWPEIDYLVRMAPVASADVASVLESIADSTNQWVRRGIVEATLLLDPTDAARLVPKMKEWPCDELANFRMDSRGVAQAIVRLLRGGAHREGMQLAQAFFGPRPATKNQTYGLAEPVTGVEPYWYRDSLPSIADALGRSRLPVLTRWLRAHQEYSNPSTSGAGYDTSHVWRESIRTSATHSSHEVGDALVDEVRRALVESAEALPKWLCRLLKDNQPLLRRIALDVLTEQIEALQETPPGATAESAEFEAGLVAAAQQVLGDESFLDSGLRAEYMPFVRACSAWGSGVDLGPFFDEVRRGPLWLRAEAQGFPASDDDTSEESEAQQEDHKKRWQHTMLTLFGARGLPEDLQATLAALDDEYGTIEVRDGSFHFEMRTGSTSPVDLDTMLAMSSDELIDQLRTWHPDRDVFMGPTHEAQGRVLSEVMKRDPARFAGRLDDLKTLRPTYIRAVVSGWRAALEAGETLSWDDVLSLSEWIVDLDESVELSSEGDAFDDDSNYEPLRSEVLRLLEAGLALRVDLGTSGVAESDAPRVLRLLGGYAEDPKPTPEYEAEYGGTNMDSLTLSLNTVRPIAIRALIRLVHRFPDTTAATDALSVLDRHIAGRDQSLAVAAAVGEGTGRLYDAATAWIQDRVSVVFGDRAPTAAFQQVALSTALATHRPHMALIELLRQPLTVTIAMMEDPAIVTGWRTDRTFPQLIGDWVVAAIVGGQMDPDDPLAQEWFEAASAELRGQVLGHLAWQVMRADTLSEEVLERVAELWDRRIAHVHLHPEDALELSGVYWLARSDKFEVEWWLPRLEHATSVLTGFDTHGMVGERLASASMIDPDTALKVLENILGHGTQDREFSHYDLLEHAVPQVLASALCADDCELRRRATELMNRLGDAGYIDLRDRVESLMKPPGQAGTTDL